MPPADEIVAVRSAKKRLRAQFREARSDFVLADGFTRVRYKTVDLKQCVNPNVLTASYFCFALAGVVAAI